MRGAIKLFKIMGISVEMHISFLILPFFFWLMYGWKGIFIIFAIFTCVAAHEFSHSMVAKKYGINVDRITLLPIGGVANMRSLPETPTQELMISIAGPLFNIVLTVILFYPLKILLGSYHLFHPDPLTWSGAVAYAYWVNPVLAGFNLIPAFPMDGGRILRAILARKFSYMKATKIAVNLGHGFALLFAFWALSMRPPNFILLFIALFIFVAASQEESIASMKTTLGGIRVKEVLTKEFYTLSPDASIAEVLNLILHSHQEDFPVVAEDKLLGFLPREKIIYALHEKHLDKKVSELMIVDDLPILSGDEYLYSAYNKMENSKLKALPVVENGKLLGIITLEDVSRIYSLFSKGEI
ncbi:MAG: site-2 protease family protein [Candidatus Omnitrophica bacterium]|nr:site-2 protease family protein [Candidatus Omnitrophota bacterium]